VLSPFPARPLLWLGSLQWQRKLLLTPVGDQG